MHNFKMNVVLAAFGVIVFISAGSAKFSLQKMNGHCSDFDPPSVAVHWLTNQRLDHFDPTNLSTWKQRYAVNEGWFDKRSGPIFLYIEGEGPLAPCVISDAGLALTEYAGHYHALVFALEHRFYGESRPTPDLEVENLRYLSSEQALADIGVFIANMNTKYNLTSKNKWVVFGGSYAGALAAWARLKHPQLIHAAVSSSGPVLAKASVEFGDFAQHVFSQSSKKCAENIHQAALQVANLLNQTGGAEVLTKVFRLCEPLNKKNSDDVYFFVESILNGIWGLLQWGGQFGLDSICKTMTTDSGDLLHRYAALVDGGGPCNDFDDFKEIITLFYKNTSYRNVDGGRPWLYQTCTEFGFYFTASSRGGFFGADLNLQLYLDICKIFGERFNKKLLDEGIERTNKIYGGLGIDVKRVVFVQGSLDPWSALGIRKSKPDAPAIVIKGASHCQNMAPSSPYDSKEMKEARKQISRLIGTWLTVQ